MVPTTNGVVYAIACKGDSEVYVGGAFTKVGDVSANNIAKWDASKATWSPLGTGINGNVKAISVDPVTGDLYVGGFFSFAGGTAANCVAKWDVSGSAWSQIGTGMDGDFDIVNALAYDGTNLYAGGYFAAAGGVAVDNIAKWNGTEWSALGTGMDEEVTALAFDGTDLYAGGFFSAASGQAVNGIAKWDISGSSWIALGAGVSGFVTSLAVDGKNLYAGGQFASADLVSARNIAMWNGTSWSTLATGMNNEVFSVVFNSGNDVLYVGGDFTTAGTVSANHIARWDGSAWSSLGSGTTDTVRAIAIDDDFDLLYAGGNFLSAGGKVSNYMAKCAIIPDTVPDAPTAVTGIPGAGSVTVSFTAPDDSGEYPILSYTVTSTPGNISSNGTDTIIVVGGLTNGTAYTFKVVAINALGKGPASVASKPVTPATVPGAPTIGTATAGKTQATIAFVAPTSNGGSPITSYTVVSSPDSITFTRSGSAATPITIAGLTAETSYTFKIHAANAVAGDGPESVASNVVIPATAPLTAIGAITGTLKVGSVLTAGALTPSAATATYQWKICNTASGTYVNIVGAEVNTYTPIATDATMFIKVVATGTGTGSYTGTVTSTATKAVPTPITAIGAIAGTPAAGQTLTAGALTPASATVTYQWSSSPTAGGVYVNISGAKAKTYKAVPGDATKFIRVTVTGTGSYSGTQTSVQVGAVTAAITAIGAIAPAPQVGVLVKAGDLTPAGATATYQWKIADTASGVYADILGETSNTYRPVAADATKFLKVTATGADDYTGSVTSVATKAIPAPITAIGATTGIVEVGEKLTAGALTPASATAAYQWASCNTEDGVYEDITGATVKTFIPTLGYTGKFLKVKATGNASFSGSVTSDAVGAVPQVEVTDMGAITGTVKVGSKLTSGVLTPSAATVSYQWQTATTPGESGVNIVGATSKAYTLADDEAGKYIKVQVTGTGSYAGTITSDVTKVTVAPIIPGIPIMGAAVAGDAEATVNFSAPITTGGSPINLYTVTSNPGKLTATTTPGGIGAGVKVTGLKNGVTYNFKVTAKNDVGTGASSSASNPVVPVQK